MRYEYCVNDVAVIGVTGITGALDTDILGCIPCDKDTFLAIYSIANLYSANPAYRNAYTFSKKDLKVDFIQ